MSAIVPLSAATIDAGKWYHVELMPNTNATPGANSDPAGAYFSPGAGPWTFNLLTAGTLEVTDAGLTGDYIRVLDGATSFLPNPQPPVSPPIICGLDPATCLANANFWHLTVALAPKAYSLNFAGIDIGNIITSAFFRVTGTLGSIDQPPPGPSAVPEPTPTHSPVLLFPPSHGLKDASANSPPIGDTLNADLPNRTWPRYACLRCRFASYFSDFSKTSPTRPRMLLIFQKAPLWNRSLRIM